MPTLVVALMEDAAADALRAKVPLKYPLSTIAIHADHVRTYPLESIIEIYARPTVTAVVRAWQGRNA